MSYITSIQPHRTSVGTLGHRFSLRFPLASRGSSTLSPSAIPPQPYATGQPSLAEPYSENRANDQREGCSHRGVLRA
jgi:hypothetical protein